MAAAVCLRAPTTDDQLQQDAYREIHDALYATERFWYGDHFYVQFTL